jgi:hypothetical protein
MFRLNETYYLKDGKEARVICVDSPVIYNGKKCPVIAIVPLDGATNLIMTGMTHVPYAYSEDGKYVGAGNDKWDLIPNEPTLEEAELIRQIGNICEGSVSSREEAMLKVIRQLRKK